MKTKYVVITKSIYAMIRLNFMRKSLLLSISSPSQVHIV